MIGILDCVLGTVEGARIRTLSMVKKFMSWLAAVAVIGGGATLFAQTKPGEGTLMVQDKNYPLTHALAYETTMDETERIVVVLSGQAVSAEKLKEARTEEKDGHDASFNRPYLKLVFTRPGNSVVGALVLASRL